MGQHMDGAPNRERSCGCSDVGVGGGQQKWGLSLSAFLGT